MDATAAGAEAEADVGPSIFDYLFMSEFPYVPSYGIAGSYKNQGFNPLIYEFYTVFSASYAASGFGWFAALGNMGEYMEELGPIGGLIWTWYNAVVIPEKVAMRNANFLTAYCEAVYTDAYIRQVSWLWTVIYYTMYPEGFEFDLESGEPLSIAGAQAVFYFGEDAGKVSQQSGIIGFVFGYFWNVITINMTLPFAPKAFAEIIGGLVQFLFDVLGGWSVLIMIPLLPFIFVSIVIYAVSLWIYVISAIPIWILQAIFGINVQREQDLITWFLGVEELGMYDPINDPVGNMFELPEAREYFMRTVDTGFESAYGINPEWKNYTPMPEGDLTSYRDYGVVFREDIQGRYISNFYQAEYPEYYE